MDCQVWIMKCTLNYFVDWIRSVGLNLCSFRGMDILGLNLCSFRGMDILVRENMNYIDRSK